ncbi:hypothetical protein [Pseudoalteromonas sp. S554]|uniref:hypothetical protein n=1 Tax=Pseudoalteromonas sp. S554 TaxID=2066516 RepID=UPI00110CE176|nr:hypothetical protein [Pseudoalteromonas sp. S554]TMS80564.1 hypothetical protein CWB65_14700 [Pseudoalteromonas sp. S554]
MSYQSDFAKCSFCGENDCDCIESQRKGSAVDLLGNKITWVYTLDDGLIVFSVNEDEITTWSCEDDCEATADDFIKTWIKTQSITLNSIKLSDPAVAEFILKGACGVSYSDEDIVMVTDELKHADTYLSNLAKVASNDRD